MSYGLDYVPQKEMLESLHPVPPSVPLIGDRDFIKVIHQNEDIRVDLDLK